MDEIKSKAIDIVSKLLKEDKVTVEEAKVLLEAISDGGGGTCIIQTPPSPHVTPTYMPQGPDYPFKPNTIYCGNGDSSSMQHLQHWETTVG